ncbi:MAG TPA: pilus assembly PilX N-terminal domain-containing protein [Gammaproteobacteria bacterium]|nr:pilus assembly PilX N-terminal domain-containing protein [Gammaproteobacteria bacterium]
MNTTPIRTARESEAGAALVVGLILMLVLTVLGVSGMNMNTLELTMASNTQSQQDAFQAAETGIDLALATRDFTTTAATSIAPTDVGGDTTAEATVQFMQTTPVPDLSFSMGVGTGSVQAFHFDITAVGEGPRNARATHTQSFYIVGPGGP